eukprot:jgi/Tetstr1/431166/TSEL_020878.t1
MFKWAALGKPICTWPRRTVAFKALFGQAPDRGYDPAFAHRDVFNKRLREYVGQRRDNQTLRTEAEYNEAMQTLRTFEQTTREE